MGAYWLFDLPDVIAAAGLDVDTWPEWEVRSRGSGGYDQVWAVFAHHTASDTSPQSDMSYMWDSTSGDQPIGAIYLARDGLVTVGAAGATNCQGQGGPYVTSHGTIKADKGNAYGIAVEAANAGTGEAWPTAQQVAYVTLCAALCDAYDLDPDSDICAHFEWTGRKIDPAGQSAYATGSGSWNMDKFRADCATCFTPQPDEEDDEMVTDDDVERIAQRAAELVWAQQVSTSEGVKAHGWVAGQNYTLTQRSMKAAEEAAANTRGL